VLNRLVYPMVKSFEALEVKKFDNNLIQWLVYWIVYGLLIKCEAFIFFFIMP